MKEALYPLWAGVMDTEERGGQSWVEDGGRLAQRVMGISLGGGVEAAPVGLLPCLCGICDRRRRLCCIHPGVLSYKTQLSL